MIEAEVFGDPEGMRALATQIAGRADVIGAVPGGFTAALDGAAFEGPAADRLRGAGATARGGIAAAVAELNGIASALFADATVVEQMNDEAKAKANAANEAADEKKHGKGGGKGDTPGGATTAPPDSATTAPPDGGGVAP
jgi:hypothetical protein